MAVMLRLQEAEGARSVEVWNGLTFRAETLERVQDRGGLRGTIWYGVDVGASCVTKLNLALIRNKQMSIPVDEMSGKYLWSQKGLFLAT
ncbi:hypothetical protein LY78DRAFT_664361 [Colletotrichum sublineola]|nr:hypothetical protein LY78DRAFT_664361 [Colletotrichum sublineola]